MEELFTVDARRLKASGFCHDCSPWRVREILALRLGGNLTAPLTRPSITIYYLKPQ